MRWDGLLKRSTNYNNRRSERCRAQERFLGSSRQPGHPAREAERLPVIEIHVSISMVSDQPKPVQALNRVGQPLEDSPTVDAELEPHELNRGQ